MAGSGTSDDGRERAALRLVVARGEGAASQGGRRGGGQARPSRARRFEVESDAALGALVEAALAECLRHVLANLEPALSVNDPEGVHQLRVALRRTRSGLRLFRRALHEGRIEALRADVRPIAARLSAARDWDVFVTETLGPIAAERGGDAGLDRLVALAEQRRRAAHDALRAELRSQEFARVVEHLRVTLGQGGWRPKPGSKRARRLERPARAKAAQLLDDRVARVNALGSRLDRLGPRQLHRLRIRVKQLRYAADMLAPLYGRKRARRYLKRVARLQDELGHVNDGRVAEALVEELVGSAAPGARPGVERAAGLVVGWSHRGARADLEAVRRAWRRLQRCDAFWSA